MSRTCGSCSMCCKLLEISELAKSRNTWCGHVVKGGGCSVYDARPGVCRGFLCHWMLNETLSPEWQPNKAKFILHRPTGELGLWVAVDPDQPFAWKRAPYYDQIKKWSGIANTGSGYVAISVGGKTVVVFPEQDLEVPGVLDSGAIRVGYRHSPGGRRPLVMVRGSDGAIVEHLGTPI